MFRLPGRKMIVERGGGTSSARNPSNTSGTVASPAPQGPTCDPPVSLQAQVREDDKILGTHTTPAVPLSERPRADPVTTSTGAYG
ncbi:hypothetical protein GCM10010140_61910 [Streptosporangium pseudovulgare]|uniref:Uncharacterized protein n=1 Tax=Streptosporangium pseudovulgare TaxID=35765 RepID=A0ABQ2RF00_9ACTN|nr:hypothetical protein GCM10010140_61910 [Streptosporangium pseudovulgare]